MWSTPIGRVRGAGIAEGISFLLLLGVAMPLKYFAGLPQAVTAIGWLHGALFVLLCAVLADATRRLRWPWRRAALVFCAALVPFGPFVIDRRLAREAARS